MNMERILIAGRGEFARRLIRHYRARGVETVSVFSEPDCDQPWVEEADYAVYLNGVSVSETYMDVHRILAAAVDSGSDSIHPGYCFLAERIDFIASAVNANVRVIATDPAIMQRGLDRFFLREIAGHLEIPLIPASSPLEEEDDGIETAAQMGLPLYVKAVAGGVLQRVDDFGDLAAAVNATRTASGMITGMPDVYLERGLDNVRQIGTTIVSDRHGDCFHLGHADKSLQLRFRSWCEEMGPSLLTEEMHYEMGAAAVALAQAIEFVGVGRVRWALTPHGGWYLLGLSSRLTTGYSLVEQVHNIDLVATQQRVLDGEELGWDGGETLPSTSAIQLRLLHIDPTQGNARPPGVLERLDIPKDVVVSTGTVVGQQCTQHTEPLLASIVVKGDTRIEALQRAIDALESTHIEGVHTNKAALLAALKDPEYAKQTHNVHLLNRHLGG